MKHTLLAVFLMLSASLTQAQFLGKIVYQKVGGGEEQMEVWFSAERIRFRSTDIRSNRMKQMGMESQEMFYETATRKLTVLLAAEKQALEVDITTLKQMLDGLAAMSGKPKQEPKPLPPATVNKTKISRKMAGYDAFKLEIRPQEGEESVDLWCSEKLKYEWHRVMDVLELGGYQSDPASAGWMAQNYVPLRLDFKKGDNVRSFEAVSVTNSVKTSDFALPAGYTPVAFQTWMQQMMMKQMMGN